MTLEMAEVEEVGEVEELRVAEAVREKVFMLPSRNPPTPTRTTSQEEHISILHFNHLRLQRTTTARQMDSNDSTIMLRVVRKENILETAGGRISDRTSRARHIP